MAKEDGGGPGLLAALTVPSGLAGAADPARLGASVMARSEGGRGTGATGDSVVGSSPVEVDDSRAGEVLVAGGDSGEATAPGGEDMFEVGKREDSV